MVRIGLGRFVEVVRSVESLFVGDFVEESAVGRWTAQTRSGRQRRSGEQVVSVVQTRLSSDRSACPFCSRVDTQQ